MHAKCLSQSWRRVSACHYALLPALLFLARDTPLHLHLSPRHATATAFLLLTSSSTTSAGILSIYILAGMSLCIV